MSACSRDRNTGSSAGAALRITRSYLRFMRNINSARRIAGRQAETSARHPPEASAPSAACGHSLAAAEDRTSCPRCAVTPAMPARQMVTNA